MPQRSTSLLVLLAFLTACGPARTAVASPVAKPEVPPAPALPPQSLADLANEGQSVAPLPMEPPDPERVHEGWKLFHIHCFRCHGFDAEGGGAPDLRLAVRQQLTRHGFIVTVIGGRPDRGMPRWGEVLQPAQAEEIYDYIVERSTGRLPPGQPPRP